MPSSLQRSLKVAWPFLFAALLFAGCRQTDLYEKNTVIPGYKWQGGFTAKGSFSIADTSSAYNIYIVLRHTDAYQYNNIWLNVGFQSPGDSMRYQKLNLTLGNDADGWEGTGMNDIWEVRKPVYLNDIIRKPGDYSFSIAQIMRDEPLLHVMSAGMRVEKQGFRR